MTFPSSRPRTVFPLLTAMRPRLRRACTERALLLCSTLCPLCNRNAAAPALRLYSAVQTSCSQRAAWAAPPLPPGQRCAPRARLAVGRSRERMRETEGKIKGAARSCLQSQSARGVAAARRLVARVPSRSVNPEGAGLGHVLSSMRYAALRWSWFHGLT